MTGQNPTITSLETQYKVEQFLYKQASALDDRNWETWLNLFSESGKYWMPASDDQKFAEGVPNIFYEDKYLMDMRIRRV